MTNVNLFISYRRSDTEHAAQRVRSYLQAKFGDEAVFIDREMPPGVDWPQELARNIAAATAVIVMIGDRFVELMDRASRLAGGERDPLLVEIEEALAADKKIYPVVVGPRDMPAAERLPASIRGLVRHNAVFAPPQYFDTAMEALTKAIAVQHGWTDRGEQAGAPAGPSAPWPWRSPGLALLMAALCALALWAAGRVLAWLLDAGAGTLEAVLWHGARYALATALLGLGPYLAYWVVAELRARAWLPIYNVQGVLTALNMGGVLIAGGVFLLLSTLPGWRMVPLLPRWLFPEDPGVLHYVLLAASLLALAVGTVALALLEPRARRGNREGRPTALRTINGLGLLLWLGVLWFAASLANSLVMPQAQDRVPVVGYLMLCPVLSLLMGAWQLAQAHLGVQRQGWQFRTLFGLLVALYLVTTLALFAYGPMRLLVAAP
jgi:hypothetical protein